jgi:hypothetical protein
MLASQNSSAQLQANINAQKDNTLYEDAAGGLSNGAGESFFAGRTGPNAQQKLRRGLIAFDLAGNIPAGAIVDSVKLRLSMSQTTSGPQPIRLHRVLADWGEGTSNTSAGNGAPATSGDATWIHRFFNTSLWTNAGGDFAAAASGSQTVGSIGIYVWNSTPQMVADVQMWLNAPASNFGWLVLGNESGSQTAKKFDSRENSNPANRPVLTVFYHPTTRVEDKKQNSPSTFHLAQNYPNPFPANGTLTGAAFGNPSTTIRFDLPAAANVTLQIFDLSGREIERLAHGKFSAGAHQVQWNAAKYAGGIYFYRLRAGNFSATRKLILVR